MMQKSSFSSLVGFIKSRKSTKPGIRQPQGESSSKLDQEPSHQLPLKQVYPMNDEISFDFKFFQQRSEERINSKDSKQQQFSEQVVDHMTKKEFKQISQILPLSQDIVISKKKNILISGIILILLNASILIGCVAQFANKRQDFYSFYKDPQAIVQRNFTLGKAYQATYTINNIYQNYTITIDYEVTMAVTNVEQGLTQFMAGLTKKAQKKIQNGNITQQIFNPDNTFLNVLLNGQNNQATQNSSNVELVPNNQSTQFQNNTVSFAPILPVYKFRLYQNGTIATYTFPKELQRQYIGLFRSITKLFSPLLDTNTYKQKKTVSKTKIRQGNDQQSYLGAGNDSNSSGTTNPDQSYEEVNQYGYDSFDGEVNLNTNNYVSSSGQTHNTEQQSSQLNQFDENGELVRGSQKSNTLFKSVEQQPDPNASVLNMNLSFASEQNSSMEVLMYFQAQMINVQKFAGLVLFYQQDNRTITTDPKGLADYILGLDQQQDLANTNESIRLLLEKDGSLSLLKYNKQIRILSTNVLGCQIGAFGYTILNFNLFQDPQNSYRKIPKFYVEVGTILKLSVKKFPVKLMNYQKQLPPVSFKFTLEQIQCVVDLIKGDFLSKLKQVWDLIVDGQFDDNLLPNIVNVLSLAEQVSSAVNATYDINSPGRIINEVHLVMVQINEAINTQGMSLLNPQNIFTGDLVQQLLSFVNVSYSEALAMFKLAKQSFQGFKDQGVGYLIEAMVNFTQNDTSIIGNRIKSLIPADIYSEYERQIKKAQPILNFVQLVQTNGTGYLRYIAQTFISQKSDFLKFIKGIVDLYFQNQTLKTDSVFNQIIQRFNNISTQVQSFKNLVTNFNATQMNNKIISLYQTTLLNQFSTTNYFFDDWRNQISTIQALANGIKDERGGCCEWDYAFWPWQDDQCVRFNPANGDQIAEPQIFSGYSKSWSDFFKSTIQYSHNFYSKCSNIISNSSLSIVEKYKEIKLGLDILKGFQIVKSVDNLINEISQRRTAAQEILRNVGCGGTNNLQQYIAQLDSLLSYLGQFKYSYLQLEQRGQNVVNSFSIDAYQKILSNFVIVQSVQNFLESYRESEQNTKKIISDIRSLVINYNPEQFVKSTSIADTVFQFYTKITESLGIICNSFEQQKSSINEIRNQYRSKLNSINQLTNNLLSFELNQVKLFLDKAATTLYSKFLETNFCLHQHTFSKQINTLTEDFNNFTVLYSLYNKMLQIINRNEQRLLSIKGQIQMLPKEFFKLFTPQGFQSFVAYTQSLAEAIKTFVYNVSIDYSNLKEESRSIEVFHIAPVTKLNQALNIFIDSAFDLKLSSMFISVNQFVKSSFNAIKSLSFDIIAVIVISKDILSYFQSTISDFREGVPRLSESFRVLCQSFLDLEQTTGQQYINEINTNFMQLTSTLNQTLFPRMGLRMDQIFTRYEKYKFKSQKLLKIKEKCFEELLNFANLTESTKQKIFKRMFEVMGKIKQLLSKLQIGNLNKVYKLAVFIRDQFASILNFFSAQIEKILSYKDQVVKDLLKIFKIGAFFNGIKSDIEKKYNQSVTDIKTKINQTIWFFEQVSPNSRLLVSNDQSLMSSVDFLNKLKNSTAFSNLEKVGEKLACKFENIWQNIKQKQTRIKTLVEKITNQSQQLIKQLSQTKDKFLNISERVKKRITNIKTQYQTVKRKLANIKSLIFISLSADFNGTIMGAMNRIINESDSIILLDLAAVKNISESGRLSKISLIADTVNLAIVGYERLTPIRDSIISKIQRGLSKIDQFLSDHVVNKMQKLKEGMLHLKAVVDNSENPKQIILYRESLYSKRAPIFKFEQPIITAIGVFMIRFDLNYTIDINSYIVLRDFRSIDCFVVFQAALVMDLRFAYSLAYILQFGLFVKGNVVRGQVTPFLNLNNIIPLQLINAIADIPQITQNNVVSINFGVDLAIYAVELDVGFYIGHIWIQLIWQPIQICFNFWFSSFCIRFRIPVGFRFIIKKHDFGLKIKGIQVVKKRLFEITLITWQY